MTHDLDHHRRVFQTAYELSERHGQNAYHYAAKLAAQAKAEGDKEDHRFREAVAGALAPRQDSN